MAALFLGKSALRANKDIDFVCPLRFAWERLQGICGVRGLVAEHQQALSVSEAQITVEPTPETAVGKILRRELRK